MPKYSEWNQALVSYFLQGVPRGSKIYLSVDEDVLERVGQGFSSDPLNGCWIDDFQDALRQKVILDEEVSLDTLRSGSSLKIPHGVAFISACVLAASRMANEDKISELNYFKRLRKILSVKGFSRPKGMKRGEDAEEPLWKEWNRWLLEQGFQPSAAQGNGPKKFINYPISQCLLRQADKDKLQHLFAEKQWTAQWDAQTLYVQVRREASTLSGHLQDLFEDRRRYEAVAEAIHELYQQWQAEGSPFTPKASKGRHAWSPNFFAGIYRIEDPFLGNIEYYLYPKQQRGRRFESVQVKYQNSMQSLQEERSGWYLPIGDPLTIKDIECGVKYSISQPSELEKLILPQRNFWILTPDPDYPDSGVYGSWGTPELGMPFILLCKKEILKDLERLKDERLLEWHDEPYPVDEQSSWVELDQCMVLSQAWDGVFIENQSLKDALQPRVKLSISFSGGLRVPKKSGWLEGYPPQVTVFGFSPKVELEIIHLLDEREVLKQMQKTNQPYSLNLPSRGTYLVRAKYSTEIAEKILRILDWSHLELTAIQNTPKTTINDNYFVCGSVVGNF